MPLDMKNDTNRAVAKELCADPDIRRVAQYGSSKFFFLSFFFLTDNPVFNYLLISCNTIAAYATTVPKAFRKIDDALFDLEEQYDDLECPFPQSVYPTVTFNLGDDISTDIHYDFLNWTFSDCAIHCFGNHDYRLGGHFVIWEWKLVIQFPPSATIIVPSSCVGHGNTPILDGKIRKSMTQYVPGGLMRHEAYGFRTEAQLKKEDPGLWAKLKKEGPLQFGEGVDLFSTVKTLKGDIMEFLRVVD